MLCNIYIYSFTVHNTLKLAKVHVISTYSKPQFITVISIHSYTMPSGIWDPATVLRAALKTDVFADVGLPQLSVVPPVQWELCPPGGLRGAVAPPHEQFHVL